MPEGWGEIKRDIGKKMKKGERFQYSIWDADSVQTWGKHGPRTARSSCRAERKCIAINMKTRCFHSIRFSQKLSDKVEWTTGEQQFVLVCCEKNKFKHEKLERRVVELRADGPPKNTPSSSNKHLFSLCSPDIIINKDNQLLSLKDQHSLHTSSLSLFFLCVPPP